ncbi:MAG: M4 family metallopeptidase [Bacteroidetes bacterium]|nr:M4 family metallopeptidase [Bacteroidota bacterium]
MRKLLLGLGMTFLSGSMMAQNLVGREAEKFHPAAQFVRFDDRTPAPLFVSFRDNSYVPASATTAIMKEVLQLSSNDSWQLIRTDHDELGMQHHRYQQFYKGIPVQTGEYIVHEQQGVIKSMNGVCYKTLPVATNPVIGESEALDRALENIGASVYLWETPDAEQIALVGHSHGKDRPKGELVILPSLGFEKGQTTSLCWKFDIYAHEPHQRYNVYINAETGKMMFKESRICTFAANGSGNTRYSGLQSFTTDSIAPGSYRLRDVTRGGGVETYDLNNGTNYGAAVDFTDADNFWNTTTNQDDAALDAHWGTQMTYDYYFQTHGRNSYNNAGAVLRSYVHYSSSYNNAFWNGSQMTYGDGNGSTFSPLTELDVVAHELTHGVTNFSSNLVYSYQSGALNESFSDIFGITVDFFARPGTANWLLGDQCYTPGTPGDALRSMSNPNSAGDPDTYLGTNWYTGTGDNGGVHQNSGVQNYWYYLLSVGGSGTNDVGFNFNVTGITIAKARMIAYRNNTFYLTSSSQYSDAAFYSLQSATDLYGNCSPEAVSVKNAWDAVNVMGLQINANLVVSASPVCLGGPIQLNAAGGVSYSWTGPGGFTSTSATPVIPVATSGTNGVYTCTVTDANGCVGSKSVTVAANQSPTVSVSGAAPICSGSSVNLSATAAVSGSGSSTGSNSTDIAIPDANQTGISSTIAIGQSTSAASIISVTIDSLIHPYVADLTLRLIAPNGSFINLASGVGGAGDNFYGTVFTSSATTAIGSGTAPFTGNFLPQSPFSNLTGSANGTWTLNVIDGFGQDLGTLSKWSIALAPNTIISYSWSPSTGLTTTTGATTSASPTSSTTYTVIATDVLGCTASATAAVDVSNIEITGIVTNPLCPGGNGTIDISLAGGSAPYSYNWSDGSTNQDLQSTTPGFYTVIVTDAAGCSVTFVRQLTSPAAFSVGISASDATCGNNDGSITLSVVGGTSPYTYLWDNGATTPAINGLAEGLYVCTITDANGCSTTADQLIESTGVAPSPPGPVSGPAGACRNQNNVTFSVAAIPGATSYNWTLPNGASGTSATNTIVVSFGSTYVTGNICVSISNACGQSSATCFQVPYLNQAASTPPSLTGTLQACAGTTQTYTAATAFRATFYNWTAPANSVIVSGQGTQTVSIAFASNFIYGDISVAGGNCIGLSSVRKLRVYNKPSIPGVISGPSTGVCAGSNGTYSIVPVVAATTYNWTAPAGATITGGQGTTSVTVDFGPTYTSGNLIVNASNSCGNSNNRILTIASKPALPGPVSGQSGSVCPGSVVTYTIAAVPGALGYNWTTPANTTILSGQGTTSVSVSFNTGFAGGNLLVNATNACGTSNNRVLSLAGAPVKPGGITLNAPITNICGLTSATYSVLPTGNTSSYQWAVPAFATIISGQGTTSITVSYSNTLSGTGNVCVSGINNCGASLPRCTTVTSLPNRPLAITGTNVVCAGQQSINYSIPTEPGVVYTWTVPSGASIVSGQGTGNIVVNWGATAGNITVFGTNNCGNSLNRFKSVAINCMLTSSAMFKASLFPNPARTMVMLQLEGNHGAYEVNMFDMTGKEVISLQGADESMELPLTGIEAGIYMVRITTASGNTEVLRLAVE